MDSYYRVEAVDRSQVQVAVSAGRTPWFGVPCATSDDAIAVDFDGHTGPRLLLGARVRLEVRLPGAEAPMVSGARVAGRAVSTERFRYLFDVDRRASDDLPRLVASALELGRQPGRSFECGLGVQIQGPGGLVSASVRGLSPAGLCVSVAEPHDRDLVVGDHVAATIDLNGAFTVSGRVVRLESSVHGVLIGIGFVPTDVDPLTRAVIEHYLAGLAPSA